MASLIGLLFHPHLGEAGRWIAGCWVIRFNGESVQLFGRSLGRAAFTALMGLMECRRWGLMLKCFALGLWQYPWGLSFWGCFLSLIDIFMPWMLSAVAGLNFGACFGLLLWLCLLCFGWVGLCLGALALALCGALPAAMVKPLAALRAALFDWRVPALALPALPWVGFALPWVGFALALPALPWVGVCFALGGALLCLGWGVGCLGCLVLGDTI